MKRMNFVWGVLVAVFVLCLSACRSTKNITQTEPHDDGGAVEWVDKMALSGLKEGTVTSKMNLDLNLGGKSLSVGGSCNLKRDEVIQLSLVAMGFMEVGRLEFTPQYMMMVNRMGREYVKVDYADVPYLQQAGVDFYTLQALLQCQFVVDLLTGLIRNTSIAVTGQGSVPRLNWTYQHFASVEQKSFPDKMQLSVTGAGKDLTAVFSLSNLKWNAKSIELTPEPGGKYKRVSPDLILKQLIK